MAFKPGDPKLPYSGRQKGTLNKRTVAKVSDFLGERGVNPAEEILKIINEKKLVTDSHTQLVREEFILNSSARADLWLELLSFCHAKPKTLEIKQGFEEFDVSEFENVATDDLMQVINKPSKTGTA